ncbi:FUSC family protein, partial [Salmonella enterica subsp. enterica serovar Carrau]
CALVANPNLGATSEKIGLRIGGALLGGFLALVLSLVVLPHIDGIVGLLLAIAPVILLGGWIAAGSERTAYIGVQVVATFCLALLEHFGPVSD